MAVLVQMARKVLCRMEKSKIMRGCICIKYALATYIERNNLKWEF